MNQLNFTCIETGRISNLLTHILHANTSKYEIAHFYPLIIFTQSIARAR